MSVRTRMLMSKVFLYGSKMLRSSEHHLPTGPKSSVAYGIKSDHKQNTEKTKQNRRV